MTDSHSMDGPGPSEPSVPDNPEPLEHNPKDLLDKVEWALDIADRIKDAGFGSRDLSIAVTHLEEARYRVRDLIPSEEAG